jgi:hypothetical protein
VVPRAAATPTRSFALVSHTWRDVAFSTPLRINLDYLVDLKWEAVRWLLKATFADLQVHPSEWRAERALSSQGHPGLLKQDAQCLRSSTARRIACCDEGAGPWTWRLTAVPTLCPLLPAPPRVPPADFHINRLLTNPDFAARNRWTLQRLWGAQMLGAPGRWPQWRHFPGLETLELSCDSMAAQPQVFESRLLAPLTQLKHLRWGGLGAPPLCSAILTLFEAGQCRPVGAVAACTPSEVAVRRCRVLTHFLLSAACRPVPAPPCSLQQFAGADLTRLPRSLRTLSADLDAVLPLRLPEGLVLEELNLATSRLLVDWGRLCKQVGVGVGEGVW